MLNNCSICHEGFQIDEPLIANSMETFIWKPATAQDSVNPAKVSYEELVESRKDFQRTEMATTYLKYDGNVIDSKFFNIRHAACVAPSTAGLHKIFSKDPIKKHSIRFSRGIKR